MHWFEIRLLIAGLILAIPFSFADNCDSALSKLIHESIASVPIPPWNMKARDLKLEASDLLPTTFISGVERSKGKVKLMVDHAPDYKYLRVWSGRTPFMNAQLKDDGSGFLIVDDLSIEDPLWSGRRSSLGVDQDRKGVSPEIFRHMRDRIVEISRAGGYKGIKTTGQNNFSAAMLYRRAVGMKPLTEEMEEVVRELDAVYRFARKELPENLRPASVEEFTKSIGTMTHPLNALTNARRARAELYFKTGATENLTVLRDSHGKDRAILFPKTPNRAEELVYVIETNGQKRVLEWKGINLVLGREI